VFLEPFLVLPDIARIFMVKAFNLIRDNFIF
jgi:hypothetical protein